jgi:peptidoglycan/xylan/chitin deacetylase (PgdA/CDA1 family)
VLTHDVETADGVAGIDGLRELEAEHGYRSSWNFVPHRYELDAGVLERLRAAGCEIGLHGLEHDGRDMASEALLRERLPAMHAYAETWGAVGFRSPATQRGWDLVAMLGFDYDSSYPDSDPYEPQPGGSCSWLPYFIGDVVELPITLPQDHTLFTILGHTDAGIWLSKAEALRARGGMVLAVTHPDYLQTPESREPYRALLEAHARDALAWRALPHEVSRWWRMRAQSVLRPDGDGTWRIHGPAAEHGRAVAHKPA